MDLGKPLAEDQGGLLSPMHQDQQPPQWPVEHAGAPNSEAKGVFPPDTWGPLRDTKTCAYFVDKQGEKWDQGDENSLDKVQGWYMLDLFMPNLP